ncbi:cytochrome c oxidase subunit 4 [Pseudoglutamicibacter albus]|uniref:cytochrome c oxidase subunit 4 n=1 Tax=Pseudoglutamicibacter albus TaxID=98671 RepID=UPI001EF48F92|nr:cytochrome c oxidase subunit 4 [Pseudoglutamicibacter albus]MCG7304176.1 cytochrome c oxidase subunit 4 [Pseudoglutamicibacter albus]
MKTSGYFFLAGVLFFIPIGIVYGFMTSFEEWVGFPALVLLGLMTGMIGYYFNKHAKLSDNLPEDDTEGEIAERAGIYGQFTPWSWWPLMLGVGVAIGFAGLAIGWWVFYLGLGAVAVGVLGWAFELNRGSYRH